MAMYSVYNHWYFIYKIVSGSMKFDDTIQPTILVHQLEAVKRELWLEKPLNIKLDLIY